MCWVDVVTYVCDGVDICDVCAIDSENVYMCMYLSMYVCYT